MGLFIASSILIGIFLIVLVIRLSSSNWARAHIPYKIRRWISMDGFNEGKVDGFSRMSKKIEDKKKK